MIEPTSWISEQPWLIFGAITLVAVAAGAGYEIRRALQRGDLFNPEVKILARSHQDMLDVLKWLKIELDDDPLPGFFHVLVRMEVGARDELRHLNLIERRAARKRALWTPMVTLVKGLRVWTGSWFTCYMRRLWRWILNCHTRKPAGWSGNVRIYPTRG